MINIDIDSLLKPIEGDNKCGVDCSGKEIYSKVQLDMNYLLSTDREQPQQITKPDDWNSVIKGCNEIISQYSKDLDTAVYLSLALFKSNGLKGLTSGLKIISGLMTNFWDCLYPIIQNGSCENRLNSFILYSDEPFITNELIGQIFITKQKGINYTYFEINYPESDESKKKIVNAISKTPVSYYTNLNNEIEFICKQIDLINNFIKEKNDGSPISELETLKNELNNFLNKIDSYKIRKNKENSDIVKDGIREENQKNQKFNKESKENYFISYLTSDKFESIEKEVNTHIKKIDDDDAIKYLQKAINLSSNKRHQSRFKLIQAQYCLKTNNQNVALQIVQEIYSNVNVYKLEEWESSEWLGILYETYINCIPINKNKNDYKKIVMELYSKLCKIDASKAIDAHSKIFTN